MSDELIGRIVSQICPQECRLTLDAMSVLPEERFWVIHAGGRPRWIIPHDCQYGLPVLTQWRPYGGFSWGMWRALLGMYRAGLLGTLPWVTSLGISGLSYLSWDHIRWKYRDPPRISIYVGNPGPTRKAIATLVQVCTNRPESILKVPLTEVAANSISQEVQALVHLAMDSPGIAPRLIDFNEEPRWSLQEAIKGRPVRAGITKETCALLLEMKHSGQNASPQHLLNRLLERLNGLNGKVQRDYQYLEHGLQRINYDRPVTLGWVHGDFAPWNLRRRSGGKVVAYDWEFAEPESPFGLDLIHYLCRTYRLSASPTKASEVLEDSIIRDVRELGDTFFSMDQRFADYIWRYYVVWYQIVLIEHGISDSFGNILKHISRRWFNEPF